MAEQYQKLESLLVLAKEPSSEKRRELLREITDVFLTDPAGFTPSEKGQLSSIMTELAFKLEMAVRRDLSHQLAAIDEAPQDLIVNLANDEIEVARPILQQSGALTTDDLVSVIDKASQEHLLAVTRRKSIAGVVSERLAQKGEERVLVSLASNPGAELTRKAQETLLEKADHMTALHEPLAHREDLDSDLLADLYTKVSTALKNHILKKAENIDEGLLDRLLEKSGKAAIEDVKVERKEMVWAEDSIKKMEAQETINEGVLLSLLRDGRLIEFIAAFARLAKTDTSTANRIVYEKKGEALAMTCRALQLGQGTFAAIYARTRNADAPEQLLSLYQEINDQAAQRAMRFWRTRQQAIKTVGVVQA